MRLAASSPTAAGSMTHRASNTSASGVCWVRSQSAAWRAVTDTSGRWTLAPPLAPRLTAINDSLSRMRSASRTVGRETS